MYSDIRLERLHNRLGYRLYDEVYQLTHWVDGVPVPVRPNELRHDERIAVPTNEANEAKSGTLVQLGKYRFRILYYEPFADVYVCVLLKPFSWIYVCEYRLRESGRQFKQRFIATCYIWGLADSRYAEPPRSYRWTDIKVIGWINRRGLK